MRALIWIFWPSFLAAIVAEFGFFAFVAPRQFFWMGEVVNLSSIDTYSIGFLFFWAICAGSSVLTYLLLPARFREALSAPAETPPLDE